MRLLRSKKTFPTRSWLGCFEASKKNVPSASEVVPTVSFSTQIFTNGIGSPVILSLTTPRICENVNWETIKKIQISLLSFIFILLSQKTEQSFYRYLILVIYFVRLIFLSISCILGNHFLEHL